MVYQHPALLRLPSWPGRMARNTPALVTAQDDRTQGNQRNREVTRMTKAFERHYGITQQELLDWANERAIKK